jgi:serine/threonine protein kinase
MKRRRDDPSALLWGFPAGFFERIEVRSCYEVDKNEVDKKSAVLNLNLFIRHVELSASNTSVTELGEGTYANVVLLKRKQRRGKGRVERGGVAVKLRKDGTNQLTGLESMEEKAVGKLFCDENGGWREVEGLQSNWMKRTKDGMNLHFLTVANYTLQDFMMLRRGASDATMKEFELDDILRQLLRGLAHIHSKGMIHGDISSNNVLITDNERKVAAWSDFGSSREVLCSPLIDCYPGTQGWYSREMLVSQTWTPTCLPVYNQSDEMWAYGVICYNFKTGEHPFVRRGDVSMFSIFVNHSMFLGAADLKAVGVAENWRELADVLPKFRRHPLPAPKREMSTVFSDMLVDSCLRTKLDGRPENAVKLLRVVT